MGNIAYPLERSSLNLPYGDARVQMLSSCGVILNVPIGTVEVAASREALQYTDITQLEIKKRLDEVLSDLPNYDLYLDQRNLIDKEVDYPLLLTRVIHIDAPDWFTALYLPFERFRKAGPRQVWAETRREEGAV